MNLETCAKGTKLRVYKDTNFFFYQDMNEVMSNIYVFCPRVNNMVLGDVDHIRIVTKHNHDSLIYSIISQHLLDS